MECGVGVCNVECGVWSVKNPEMGFIGLTPRFGHFSGFTPEHNVISSSRNKKNGNSNKLFLLCPTCAATKDRHRLFCFKTTCDSDTAPNLRHFARPQQEKGKVERKVLASKFVTVSAQLTELHSKVKNLY